MTQVTEATSKKNYPKNVLPPPIWRYLKISPPKVEKPTYGILGSLGDTVPKRGENLFGIHICHNAKFHADTVVEISDLSPDR